MTFNLTIHGDTPAELLEVLQRLNPTKTSEKEEAVCPSSTADDTPTCTSHTPAPTRAAAATTARAAAASAAATPTTSASEAAARNSTPAPSPATSSSAPAGSAASTSASGAAAGTSATASAASTPTPTTEPDPVSLDKIRDLARNLIVQGRSKDVQQIIQNAGAKMLSKLPAESYTSVWAQLVNLSKEVDDHAAD